MEFDQLLAKMGILKGLMILGVGLYGGVYICQNYDIPKMDDPQNYFKKFQDYISQFEKPDKPK